jgi:hypothetical protein
MKEIVSPTVGLFPGIDPLPRAVLDQWHRTQASQEWDKVEAMATQAQAAPRFED